jgi:hypothetical protein
VTKQLGPRAGKVRFVMSASSVLTGRICLRGPSSVPGTLAGQPIGTYRKDGRKWPVLQQVDRLQLSCVVTLRIPPPR